MRGKIIKVSNEQREKYIGFIGKLIFDYHNDGKLHIERDDGKTLNMTKIKKLTVETKNTIYEIEIEEE